MGLCTGLCRRRRHIPPRKELNGEPLEHWKEISVDIPDSGAFTGWQPPEDPNFWFDNLTAREYKILRKKGTEPPRSSAYDKFYPKTGYFACRACGLPLYAAKCKFDSGTGWPSFGEHIEGNVVTENDFMWGIRRSELQCAQCHSHLGHVFAESNQAKFDRLKTFKERQCLNGLAIMYVNESLPKGSNPHATALEHSD